MLGKERHNGNGLVKVILMKQKIDILCSNRSGSLFLFKILQDLVNSLIVYIKLSKWVIRMIYIWLIGELKWPSYWSILRNKLLHFRQANNISFFWDELDYCLKRPSGHRHNKKEEFLLVHFTQSAGMFWTSKEYLICCGTS